MLHTRRPPLSFVLIFAIALAGGCSSDHPQRHADASNAGGFRPIFNGKDLTGWTYGTKDDGSPDKTGEGYRVENGVIYCTPTDGGNLFTQKEYGDFVLRFAFKLTPNANNGIAIR